MSRILVTGGAGVIGSWVTRQLVERAHTVTVLDRREDHSLLGSELAAKIRFLTADLSLPGTIGEIIRPGQYDAIAHLAAAVGHRGVEPSPKTAFDLNVGITLDLLEAARLADIGRFVFASSRCVYGEITGVHAHPIYQPIEETQPLSGDTLYDTAKIASEGLGRAFAAAYGMQFAALRFGTIYGPGKTARHKSFGVLSQIIESPSRGEPVSIARGGEQRDDIIYVEDAAAGVVATLTAPSLAHSAYNISTGHLASLGELAEAVRRHFPDAQIEIGGGLNYFGDGNPNYSGLLANGRAASDLGFRAEPNIGANVDRYYRAMRDLRLT